MSMKSGGNSGRVLSSLETIHGDVHDDVHQKPKALVNGNLGLNCQLSPESLHLLTTIVLVLTQKAKPEFELPLLTQI